MAGFIHGIGHRIRLSYDLYFYNCKTFTNGINVFDPKSDMTVTVTKFVVVFIPIVGKLYHCLGCLIAISYEYKRATPRCEILTTQFSHAQHIPVECH